MSQLGYYFIIILLGLGNLAFAVIAYRQRDRQIQGNALRETQVELAEIRNEMAKRRMDALDTQNELLGEIRDALTLAGSSSPPETRPSHARTSQRSSRQPPAPA
jgi:hypothetical protein